MSNYFSKVPNFEYVSRLPDANISDYIEVKNLFKRAFLREDIFQDLAFFTKYQIIGDDRPDNVAFKIYEDSSLDWVVLISNNIINVQSEWPMRQYDFDRYLLNKYGTYEKLNEVHHHETVEIKNEDGVVLVAAGLTVSEDYTFDYYNFFNDSYITEKPVKAVTNYQYEEKLNEDKRNIFLLKPRYLSIVIDDLEDIMRYKKGSSQYKTESLKTADNIRLYE
jgi:hypothetical protein|tara:strand:+ start:678 stop:1340 length:663 start_codon:yes stop_codon:yes gene_type:complete